MVSSFCFCSPQTEAARRPEGQWRSPRADRVRRRPRRKRPKTKILQSRSCVFSSVLRKTLPRCAHLYESHLFNARHLLLMALSTRPSHASIACRKMPKSASSRIGKRRRRSSRPFASSSLTTATSVNCRRSLARLLLRLAGCLFYLVQPANRSVRALYGFLLIPFGASGGQSYIHDTFQGLLFIGDLGKDDYLDETTHRRLPVLITEHFKNSVVCSNCLFCIGASAMQSFSKQNAKRLLPPPKVQTFVCECCKCCGRLAMLTVASSGNLLLCAHAHRRCV
jgi:hypothetical protein